jgi:hypothetical protein
MTVVSMSDLSKRILSTIVYYDIFDYSLTSFEIWKYLIRSKNKEERIKKNSEEMICLLDVIKELEKDEIKKHLDKYRGFYFLKGRKELVEKRIERNKISESKIKILKKAIWFLRFVPFVRMIAVAGRMAMKSADKDSDLDLLIILKKGKIFTGRILTTLIIHLLGVRRYGNKIKDRICLNHFMADEDLETGLHSLFSSSEHSQSLHLFASSEYSFIYPVFGWETFQNFQRANEWIKNYRINYQADEVKNMKLIEDSDFSRITRKIGEFFFRPVFFEKVLKKWQMGRIINDPRTHQAGSFVTANNKELIFLPKPQGPEIEGKFQKKLGEMVG